MIGFVLSGILRSRSPSLRVFGNRSQRLAFPIVLLRRKFRVNRKESFVILANDVRAFGQIQRDKGSLFQALRPAYNLITLNFYSHNNAWLAGRDLEEEGVLTGKIIAPMGKKRPIVAKRHSQKHESRSRNPVINHSRKHENRPSALSHGQNWISSYQSR